MIDSRGDKSLVRILNDEESKHDVVANDPFSNKVHVPQCNSMKRAQANLDP